MTNIFQRNLPQLIPNRQLHCFFYTKLGVSLGYCADIADMPKLDFIRFLSDNGVSVFNFESEDELKEDIANA